MEGGGISYLGEFRANARPLIGATIGSGVGNSLMAYLMAVFAPHLIKDFGWSKAQFALIGVTVLGVFLIFPVMGRAADMFGTRKVAMIGVVGMPACYLAYSQMPGSFLQFFVLTTALILLSTAASALTYTRVVAERFVAARGLALTVITCAPALVGAIAIPLLNGFVEAYGWRAGYQLVALVVLAAGLLALFLIGPPTMQAVARLQRPRGARQDYALILKARAFWLIAGGMALCSLPSTLHSSQMQLMLLDNHLSSSTAALMISIYATSTVIGRLLCGVALDRFAAHAVAAVSLGIPTIGLALLATSLDSFAVIMTAVVLIGLAVGAESDVIAFLVARWFAVDVYSSAYGLVAAGIPLAVTLGSLILAAILAATDSFVPFLWLSAGVVFVGSLLFFSLGRAPEARS